MKILVTESQFKRIILREGDSATLIGYRSIHSVPKGIYGTWYYIPNYDINRWKPKELYFKNLLYIPQSEIDVRGDEDYVMQYLIDKWFPNLELEINVDDDVPYENGDEDKRMEMMVSKMIRDNAIKLGYDGIRYGDLEVVDYNDQ